MTLDTNSNYLSKFLFGRGVDVVRISVIPDEEDAKAFDVPLEVHEPTKEALRQYLVADHRGHDLNDDRLRMVTFPQEDNVAFEDRAYNVQVTLYSRVGDDIRAALPAAVAAIEGWVHEDVEVA
ncbi:hypothetical protein DYB37_000045 [Aphanomyces astaci]|uniref:Uncharacterized protein n=1 Tax=Aphanomyces astaci TaxID=112090 RepID=A0A3R6XKW3_APHAT|nr:hypothetical protein DYB35_003380 [Aphanomyces astaci]RHZ24742.1 hypothetical protein DYB37_000045 [Aphanomyces astaci]